ncbi:MAG: 50S ribosomal protein L4 [Candidatus Margulisiibacteriota bacterium]|nr:MAG: 50S ribosomal protein L4 [Candidatus Margulisiibacteriota bacterium]
MVILQVYDFKKDQKDMIEVNSDIFDVVVKNEVMHQVVEAYLAGGRTGSANTKNRSDVSGGGRKPWKQKGTGRARAGSTRSPLWRGGGVIFGPTPRDFVKKINKKVKRLALKMALSAKRTETLVVRGFEISNPKTNEAIKLMKKADINNSLIIMNMVSDNLARATNNIAGIKVIRPNEINVYELLKFKNICIDSEALSTIDKELTK